MAREMRTMLLLLTGAMLTLATIGCTSSPQEKDKVYDIKAKVVSVDTDKQKIRLNHEDVIGLMKAMEMDFTVSDAKVLSGIKAGDEVHGRLKVESSKYIITELHKR
jgi:Cu/Ag efflux protein CusF